MALYRLREGGVRNTVTNQDIPNAPGNRDWIFYQDWLLLGNTPDPVAVIVRPTLDEEFDGLSDWIKELIGPGIAAFKAKITARRQ